MGRSWEGHYLDGRTAARQRVAIRLMRAGLQVTTEGGATLWWPYEEIRQTQGFYGGEQVRLERGEPIAETLLIPEAAFLTALREAAGEQAGRFHDPARRRRRALLTGVAGMAAIGVAAALYAWGIPLLARALASYVPVAWEERLGQAVVEHLAPPAKRCDDPARARAIGQIVQALLAPVPKPPYTFRVIVLDARAVNAFAAPGGYIVLFRGLVERTGSPEELAGVLAHEIQHILQRHATRAVLQHASTGVLLAALAGDPTGAMTYGLQAARTLGALRYSRTNEEEADAEGMRMLLAAGIDPSGMIALLESFRRREGRANAIAQYLSTHPLTAERIDRLRALAGPSRQGRAPLLPGQDWQNLRRVCAAPRAPD